MYIHELHYVIYLVFLDIKSVSDKGQTKMLFVIINGECIIKTTKTTINNIITVLQSLGSVRCIFIVLF